MHPSSVLIHCTPAVLDYVKENNMNWRYSPEHGNNEIDIVVDDVPYEIIDGTYQDPDEQLCEHYGIDYNHVNMIEAVY